jgi:hypothetical protein
VPGIGFLNRFCLYCFGALFFATDPRMGSSLRPRAVRPKKRLKRRAAYALRSFKERQVTAMSGRCDGLN